MTVIGRLLDRVGDAPVYVSVDIDVLDPALRSPDAIERLYGLPIVGNLGSRR